MTLCFLAEMADERELTADVEMPIDVANVAFDSMRTQADQVGDLVAQIPVQQHRQHGTQARCKLGDCQGVRFRQVDAAKPPHFGCHYMGDSSLSLGKWRVIDEPEESDPAEVALAQWGKGVHRVIDAVP